jgi:hypothetical protein
MRSRAVNFYSEGEKLAGFLRLPDGQASGPLPAIVHGPGWLGLASAQNYEPWHRAFTAAGYAVLAFDYRGFGSSGGQRGWIRPDWQVEDIVNAVTYLTTCEDIDHERIGIYGMGGTGGANAIIAAAGDLRIKCVAAQSVVADGADWLHRMRREYEWVDYLRRLDRDSQAWVTNGSGESVHPRTDLMVETPERRQAGLKKDVDSQMPEKFYLQSARFIMRCNALDYVSRISPRALLLTCVEDDVVTPEDHAMALFRRAGEPKRLIRQSHTTHYGSYRQNYERLCGEIVRWFRRYLRFAPVTTQEEAGMVSGPTPDQAADGGLSA